MLSQEIDKWLEAAIKAQKKAYAIYSGFKVGSVVISEQGKIYYGCNVENKAYGATICAEKNAITTAVSEGLKKIKVLAVIADHYKPVAPCGSCRQIIAEFSDSNTQIIMANKNKKYKIFTIKELLPYRF